MLIGEFTIANISYFWQIIFVLPNSPKFSPTRILQYMVCLGFLVENMFLVKWSVRLSIYIYILILVCEFVVVIILVIADHC